MSPTEYDPNKTYVFVPPEGAMVELSDFVLNRDHRWNANKTQELPFDSVELSFAAGTRLPLKIGEQVTLTVTKLILKPKEIT